MTFNLFQVKYGWIRYKSDNTFSVGLEAIEVQRMVDTLFMYTIQQG